MLRNETRWLQPGEYLSGVLAACIGLGLRRALPRAVAWVEEATWHSGTATRIADGTVNGLDFIGIGIAGLLEQPTIGLERIGRVSERLASTHPSRISVAGYQVALTSFHFRLERARAPFEEAVSKFRAQKLPPWNCPYNLSTFWIVHAYGRLSQALHAPKPSAPSASAWPPRPCAS